jgi:GAF domain-containing protein/DNA-binding CsgD family transcriptional regulator
MYTRTEHTSPLKLFQQIGRSIRTGTSPDQVLQSAVDALGWQFSLDRAVALVMDEGEHELKIKAEYRKDHLAPVGKRQYQLLSGSEMYRLLSQGRPVPLTEIQADASMAALQPELHQFIKDSGSKSVVAFPLVHQGVLVGCFTAHHCQEDRTFSEEMLEVGEAFAEELAMVLQQANRLNEKVVDGRVFASSALPLVVLESGSLRIAQTNAAAARLLDGEEAEMRGLPFLELFGETDATRIKEGVSKLSPNIPIVNVPGLLAPTVGGQTVTLDAAISNLTADGKTEIVVALYPAAGNGHAGSSAQASERDSASSTGRVEELVASLSRQLTWERMARQIIAKMHSSLDRDTVLQTAADSVGRGLRASACLIIRTDSPAASLVTHEYADPNLSPLGLGRSGQWPSGAIANLKQRPMVINDLSSTTRPSGLSREDVNALLENGVGAMMSTPISYHGVVYGIIVVQSNDAREWSQQEIEMLETIAQQAALALANAQSYALVKDQLFNMNLISNLTQQLTNALDMAGRGTRNERPAEIAASEASVTPLSSRELEVLKLIASGLANREIAQKLFLTESTVELHASRIRKKLKLKSRTALVKYACDNHLV